MKQTSQPFQIECSKCGGKGKLSIPETLIETLAEVGKKGVTTLELLPKLPLVQQTALSCRLISLYKLGLLKRRREGKFYRYFKATT